MYISILLTLLSCRGEKEKNLNSGIQNKEIEIGQKLITEISEEERNFWAYDTLLFKEYTSSYGNKIQLKGSQSRDLYRISTKSKKGFNKNFDLTKNSYIASHSSILWDNDNYLFVRYGCGSPCWGGKILSLNNNQGTRDYKMYLFVDSVKNIIVYPEDGEYLVLENFAINKRSKVKFEFCQKSPTIYNLIDTIYSTSNKSVTVKYISNDCDKTKIKDINLN
ncbi:hypothetical protein [Aureibacter tunicatorum]|uniref:Uncharacterized protein n=1 Tax=Aureibacter tunicatorum TaxID=866807 RepID=A0AAE3XR99_9BACT|nr:hypothetical protein [Aureibacter tunicatorum]MDR6239989.1 hypothetical protein [Aureibacter tunicatorum]BDD04461.1 hypothetical protein AUTU_19440 [Aureibacter tunicatorum]